MLPTLAEILELDVVRRGAPRVLAAADRLDTPVRWVHAIELPDAARLLRGGELVLMTGIALPEAARLLSGYVAELASVGVSGLAVELGRRYTAGLPADLVGAARRRGLPLIAFERELPFIDITEAVHARIIDAQLGELRAAARLHEVFTDLSVAGAAPAEILRQAAVLAGRPVILADLSHHVLACEPAGADPARLLADFETRARAAGQALTAHPAGPLAAGQAAAGPATLWTAGRTGFDAASGWLLTTVGARGEDWGRVILVCDAPPAPGDVVLIERAATTLALARLITRDRESLERQAHRTLITGILAQADADLAETEVRARALGLPVTGRQLLTMVVRFRDTGAGLLAQARVLEVAEALAEACRAERIPALAGSLDDMRAAALLSVSEHADPDTVLGSVCAAVRRRLRQRAGSQPGATAGTGASSDQVIGVGSTAGCIEQVRRSLLEARQVADAAARAPDVPDGRTYRRLSDLRLRGLLYLLGEDTRVSTFAERELGPLLAYDTTHGTGLTGVLACYLEAGGNKADAATRAHLARPTLYERLRHIERILGVSLDSPESRASLHVALLARESARLSAR